TILKQIRDEMDNNTYQPMPVRKKEIPKDGGKVRVLSIPSIRDRVVQGALKLILEPIFEADFQSGSYGYRPKRTAHQAVNRVVQAIVEEKTRVIDVDLRSYFGAPGQARRFQRVRFPPRQGNEPPHRESSLGLMKVTTWRGLRARHGQKRKRHGTWEIHRRLGLSQTGRVCQPNGST